SQYDGRFTAGHAARIAQCRRREDADMPRRVERHPVDAETAMTPAAGVRRNANQGTARTKHPAADSQQSDRVDDVLDDVIHHDRVEAPLCARQIFQRADMDVDTGFRLHRAARERIDVLSGNAPAERFEDREAVSSAAADLQQLTGW